MGCTTFTNGPPEDVRGFAAPQPSRVMAGALPPLPDTVHVRGNDGRCDWCADAWPCAFEQQADQERWRQARLCTCGHPRGKHFLSPIGGDALVRPLVSTANPLISASWVRRLWSPARIAFSSAWTRSAIWCASAASRFPASTSTSAPASRSDARLAEALASASMSPLTIRDDLRGAHRSPEPGVGFVDRRVHQRLFRSGRCLL
jgi:hypothetical protein